LMPEETVTLMGIAFLSPLFMCVFNAHSYMDWLFSVGQAEFSSSLMEFTRDALLLFQDRSQMDLTKQRWLLKDPWYLMMLDDVTRVYPGALIIHTHRKPDECVASLSSVFSKLRGVNSDNLDLGQLGVHVVEFTEAMLKNSCEKRREWMEAGNMKNRVVDIYLNDLKNDPIGTVENIYETFNISFRDSARANMSRWLVEQTRQSDSSNTQKFVHGKHEVGLDLFDLDSKSILARPIFQQYCHDFGFVC
jgi:hypothetical protein